MLRLRGCLASQLLSYPSTSPVSHLHCLLSATAPPLSPNPPISPSQGFAVEDYLVHTCGLTRPQALKASTKLSHLKSPANPDAVLAFLAGLGLSGADVSALVAKDPRLLCAGAGRTLAPRVAGLTGIGMSGPDIARLISLVGIHFRLRSVVSKVHFYLLFFGSTENFLRLVKLSPYLLSFDLERTVKPNIALLRECWLDNCNIAKLCMSVPRMLTAQPERLRAMVACAERIGVSRDSGMFRHALHAVAFLSEEKIAAKVDYLKKTFRWSDTELSIAVSKAPTLLRKSEDTLWRKCEFLISEVGLEPVYIAHRSTIINYSMEGRLRPRYYVLRFLKANGLVDQNLDYYYIVNVSEEAFVKKFICPHKEAAPHLAEDYEATCRGEVSTRFRFT